MQHGRIPSDRIRQLLRARLVDHDERWSLRRESSVCDAANWGFEPFDRGPGGCRWDESCSSSGSGSRIHGVHVPRVGGVRRRFRSTAHPCQKTGLVRGLRGAGCHKARSSRRSAVELFACGDPPRRGRLRAGLAQPPPVFQCTHLLQSGRGSLQGQKVVIVIVLVSSCFGRWGWQRVRQVRKRQHDDGQRRRLSPGIRSPGLLELHVRCREARASRTSAVLGRRGAWSCCWDGSRCHGRC